MSDLPMSDAKQPGHTLYVVPEDLAPQPTAYPRMYVHARFFRFETAIEYVPASRLDAANREIARLRVQAAAMIERCDKRATYWWQIHSNAMGASESSMSSARSIEAQHIARELREIVAAALAPKEPSDG